MKLILRYIKRHSGLIALAIFIKLIVLNEKVYSLLTEYDMWKYNNSACQMYGVENLSMKKEGRIDEEKTSNGSVDAIIYCFAYRVSFTP